MKKLNEKVNEKENENELFKKNKGIIGNLSNIA